MAAVHAAAWWIDQAPDDDPFPTIRILPGEVPDVIEALCDGPWRVDAASNRQGLRLQGQALTPDTARERISEPIVLLADAQTHGGYPRIAHAIRADWPKLAQLRPGDSLSFRSCTPAAARRALELQRQRFARLALAIEGRSRAC